jgi:hypothetical protein
VTVFHSEILRYSATRVHPLLTGWLDKLEPCRTDLAGLQRHRAELDSYRAEMFAFLRCYDVILAPAYRPALPHGAPIRDESFRGFSDTMTHNVAGRPTAAAALEQGFGGWKAPKTL